MKKLFFVLTISCSIFTFSQNSFNAENYTVYKSDIETNTYPKDSTANALVLFEYGNSYIDKENFNLKTEIKRKIKILNKGGFNRATISIRLYKDGSVKEKVENIMATTYNIENGEIVKSKLTKQNVFTEKIDENYSIVKFTLPNIKEGSVITYSYTRESPYKYKYYGWSFQDYIPTLYSEYKASIPGNYTYNIKLVGKEKLFKRDEIIKKRCITAFNGGSADCAIVTYAMKDIPAFVEEDYMTAEENYLSRIDYELSTVKAFDGTTKHYTKSWKDVDKELKTEPTIGRQLNKSNDFEDYISNEIINNPDELKKAKAIFEYIQDNFTWNKKIRLFREVAVKNLLKNKSGNSTEINILLHNWLKESGVNVKPVLVSTRQNGFPTRLYPVISDFNYLIVQAEIDDKTYLLDATDVFLYFGQIPFKCLNQYGRLLDFKNGSKWIDINSGKVSYTLHRNRLKLNADENLSGEIHSKYTGYHALPKKRSYFTNVSAYIDQFDNNNDWLEVIDHQSEASIKNDIEFADTFKVEFSENNIVGNKIYINPFIQKFFDENPFKLQERTYPIDFGYKDSFTYMLELDFGNNYTIVDKPKDQFTRLPNNTGDFRFSVQNDNNKVTLLFKITFKKSLYDSQYYPYLKEFMSKIVNIQNNSLIVLEKK